MIPPVLARTRLGIAAARRPLGSPVVLVPTMGALHDGHRALIRHAVGLAAPDGAVIVSIFVNPLQFGPGEDLDRYPHDLTADTRMCEEEGVAVVFAPSATEMYPSEMPISFGVGRMGEVLEGASRPGHFAGVLTAVHRLFQLTLPDIAVFGEKDAQQLALVRHMTADFGLGVEIVNVPIVREPDGLAMSSRNRYLSPAERATALAIPRALAAGAAARAGGQAAVLAAAREVLETAATADPPLAVDYLALADPRTFAGLTPGYSGDALLLVAAKVGSTRLIDNTRVAL